MYKILLVPLAAGLIAQVAKFFIKSNKLKLGLSGFTSYSGMPSAHSTIVSSLTTIVGLEQGFSSPLFAFSIIFALIVIRDALGIRQYLGQHGKVLNILVKDLKDDKVLDETYPHLLEKIGHTPAQVVAGITLGILIGLFGYYI